ncbi:tripartite-type tricarboxylate transporter receptor subunit TctC [Kushneria sinocarnis]|uniref:Tripartite-type tricarboxylate transporter receptor subunit TctC n=1 Tax=Kushneria sinocarnis TaxID=595502 RepID=A0A420X1B0_9GAMM|nr:tripartite tricarboxylate transporter substrate binding protein [Kushneria sinocarnis]RKR07631.1 tripartite-type tricarboxylate transporter receptor subunit TctC [Kushneria sinocarnis]
MSDRNTFLAFGMAGVLAAGTLAASATMAAEDNFPDGNITFLVAAGAGGGTDNFARTIQPLLEERLDTTVNVINLPTASGAIAHQRTASGKADGRTLDFASSTLVTSLAAGQNPTGLDQLTPVARMQSDVMALVVNPDKYEDLEAFMEHAREQPGDTVIGGTAAASPDKMAFLAFQDATGLDLSFVPYDQEGSTAANVLSGNIDGMFNEISSITGYTESGKMKPILFFAEQPLEGFSEVPTTVGQGWDLTNGNERGVFVSAKTSPELVNRLESALHEIYQSDQYQQYAERVHLDYRDGWMGSDAYQQKLQQDLKQYRTLLKQQ